MMNNIYIRTLFIVIVTYAAQLGATESPHCGKFVQFCPFNELESIGSTVTLRDASMVYRVITEERDHPTIISDFIPLCDQVGVLAIVSHGNLSEVVIAVYDNQEDCDAEYDNLELAYPNNAMYYFSTSEFHGKYVITVTYNSGFNNLLKGANALVYISACEASGYTGNGDNVYGWVTVSDSQVSPQCDSQFFNALGGFIDPDTRKLGFATATVKNIDSSSTSGGNADYVLGPALEELPFNYSYGFTVLPLSTVPVEWNFNCEVTASNPIQIESGPYAVFSVVQGDIITSNFYNYLPGGGSGFAYIDPENIHPLSSSDIQCDLFFAGSESLEDNNVRRIRLWNTYRPNSVVQNICYNNNELYFTLTTHEFNSIVVYATDGNDRIEIQRITDVSGEYNIYNYTNYDNIEICGCNTYGYEANLYTVFDGECAEITDQNTYSYTPYQLWEGEITIDNSSASFTGYVLVFSAYEPSSYMLDYLNYWASKGIKFIVKGLLNSMTPEQKRDYIKSYIASHFSYYNYLAVLIVGDASDYEETYNPNVYPNYWNDQYWLDRRNYYISRYVPGGQQALNQIPTYYHPMTVHGEGTTSMTLVTPYYATDQYYTDLTGDGIMDIPISRVPASTVNEAMSYFHKALTYNMQGANIDAGEMKYDILVCDACVGCPDVQAYYHMIYDEVCNSVRPYADTREFSTTVWKEMEQNGMNPDLPHQLMSNIVTIHKPDVVYLTGKSSDRYQLTNFDESKWDMLTGEFTYLLLSPVCESTDFARTEYGADSNHASKPIGQRFLFMENYGAIAIIGPTAGIWAHGIRELSNTLASSISQNEVSISLNLLGSLNAVANVHDSSSPYDLSIIESLRSIVMLGDPLTPVLRYDMSMENTEVLNNDDITEVRIYPNPVSECMDIELTSNKSYYQNEVSIYDLLGRKVWTHHIDTGEIIKWFGRDNNNRLLPSGTYYLKCNLDDKEIVKKITVIR